MQLNLPRSISSKEKIDSRYLPKIFIAPVVYSYTVGYSGKAMNAGFIWSGLEIVISVVVRKSCDRDRIYAGYRSCLA